MTPEEQIIASLRSDQNSEVLAAIKEAGSRRLINSVERITDILADTHNSSLRNAAAIALMDIGDPHSLNDLYAVLLSLRPGGFKVEKDPGIGTILYAMSGFPKPTTLPAMANIEDFVRRFIFDDNFEVREMSRRVLRNWEAECECENNEPIWPSGIPIDYDRKSCPSCELMLPTED